MIQNNNNNECIEDCFDCYTLRDLQFLLLGLDYDSKELRKWIIKRINEINRIISDMNLWNLDIDREPQRLDSYREEFGDAIDNVMKEIMTQRASIQKYKNLCNKINLALDQIELIRGKMLYHNNDFLNNHDKDDYMKKNNTKFMNLEFTNELQIYEPCKRILKILNKWDDNHVWLNGLKREIGEDLVQKENNLNIAEWELFVILINHEDSYNDISKLKENWSRSQNARYNQWLSSDNIEAFSDINNEFKIEKKQEERSDLKNRMNFNITLEHIGKQLKIDKRDMGDVHSIVARDRNNVVVLSTVQRIEKQWQKIGNSIYIILEFENDENISERKLLGRKRK